MTAYFSQFPNVYVGMGVKDDSPIQYQLAKNLFRRLEIRDDIEKYVTLFEKYSVQENESPSIIANKIYGDPFLDWTILLTNNINDFYTEWPKSQYELETYVRNVYDAIEDVHHWETLEVFWPDIDEEIVLMPGGMEVKEDHRTMLPDGQILSKAQSIIPITNYEHESYLNELKRVISLPSSGIVQNMVQEMEDLLAYKSHPELDVENNKKTQISIIGRFLENTGYISPVVASNSNNSGTQSEVSFDNGAENVVSGLVGIVVGTASSTATPTATTGATTTTTTTTTSSTSSSSSSSSSGGY